MSEVKWTPDQQNAIDHDGSSLLISAAAGSGKTAVLSQRVMEMLKPDENGNLSYNYDDHTSADVQIFAYGHKADLFDGVTIENIQIARKDIYIQGKNRDSVAFTINDIKFVQFKLKNGDPLYDFMNEWGGEPDDIITFNVVGECSINEYQNNLNSK